MLKKLTTRTKEFVQENAVLIVGTTIVWAFIGGKIVAERSYHAGYYDASREALEYIRETFKS